MAHVKSVHVLCSLLLITFLHDWHLCILIYWLTAHLSNLLTYLLTPCSRVLLEKLTGFQLVKKFPAFYGTRRLITPFASARHLSLSWASSIQSIPTYPISYFLKVHLNIILPSTPGSPHWFYLLGVCTFRTTISHLISLRTMYDTLSLTNCTLWTADAILWCTKNPVPNWWFSFSFA